MNGLSRRELLVVAAAATAAPLPARAALPAAPLTLIADRSTLPSSWTGKAWVLEPGTFIDEAWLAALPAGPAAAALTPANAFLLAETLRVRRRPLMQRAGLLHFTVAD